MGEDLDATGMVKVSRSIDRMPASYYELADLAGLLYHTPLLEARLYRYPAFLGLAETPEFQGLLNDKQFTELWQKQVPIRQLIDYPGVKSILDNPGTLNSVWAVLQPNFQDLGTFLTNGVSPKFDAEKILGRWDFDVNPTIGLLRRTRPTISSGEMLRVRRYIAASFGGTTLVAMPDHRALLKNYPHVKMVSGTPTTEMLNIEGQWARSGDEYTLSYTLDGKAEEATVAIQVDRLTFSPSQGLGLVLVRED